MDGWLKDNLDYLKKMIENKWDGTGMLCGFPGTGKTTLSHQICFYMDKTFDLDRVVFSGEELMKCIDTAKRGEAICFDEAVFSLMSQDFASEIQKVLIKKFTVLRSKNLFILFIIPGFFLMRKFFSVDRTRFMINCYSPDALSRGYFEFYSYNRKKQLFLRGYKENDMTAASPNFRGRFPDTEGFIIDPIAYEAKKQAALKALSDKNDKKGTKEKLMESYKDKCLKIAIDNKMWRNKIQEKYNQKYAELKQKVLDFKKHQKTELSKIETESIDLQRSKDKEKIKELESEYSKLLYFGYDKMNEYWQSVKGEQLDLKTYFKMINEERVSSLDSKALKRYFESGEQYSKLFV
jgi:hypothetical protein